MLGLSLSGAAFAAQVLILGWTGPQSDVLLLALAALWRLRRPAARSAGDIPGGAAPVWLPIAAAAAASLVAALFVEQSLRYPDGGWDARAIWNLRARSLFAAPRDLALVFAPSLTHTDYPPLLPALIAHGWFALGRRTAAVPIATSALFAAGGAAALWRAVAAARGRAAGWAALLVLLGTPAFLTLAFNQYADLKLSMLLLVAAVLASQGRAEAAGLAAVLAALTKNEGLFEAAAIAAILGLAAGPRAVLRMLAGAAAPLLLLVWFKLRLAPQNYFAAAFVPAQALPAVPSRLWPVARGFALQAVDFGAWGAALAVVAAGWIWRLPARPRQAPALSFVALCLGLFVCIYLLTPLEVSGHIASSLDRLLFQIWPTALYASAFFLPPARAEGLPRAR